MGKLDGKVAIVTGCSSGIGKQIAIRFAEEGAKLAICARREDMLNETASICEERGAQVLPVKVDVSKTDEMEQFVNAVVARFGTVDILVNNAMSGVPYVPFEDIPLSYFDNFVQNMLYSNVRMMQLCFPYMKNKEASIINLGSSTSLGSNSDSFYQTAYGTMKGAIAALTRCVAGEWVKYNIRVNLIYPIAVTEAIADPSGRHSNSGILAEMANCPLKRYGDPYKDVAPVAVFLASSDSAYMTGQALRAEGGRYMGIG